MHSGRITGQLECYPLHEKVAQLAIKCFLVGRNDQQPRVCCPFVRRRPCTSHAISICPAHSHNSVSLSALRELSCPPSDVPPSRFFHAENTHTHKHIKLMRVTFLFHGPRVLVLVFIYKSCLLQVNTRNEQSQKLGARVVCPLALVDHHHNESSKSALLLDCPSCRLDFYLFWALRVDESRGGSGSPA